MAVAPDDLEPKKKQQAKRVCRLSSIVDMLRLVARSGWQGRHGGGSLTMSQLVQAFGAQNVPQGVNKALACQREWQKDELSLEEAPPTEAEPVSVTAKLPAVSSRKANFPRSQVLLSEVAQGPGPSP